MCAQKSFRDAYTSEKDVLRREVEREGERRKRATERGRGERNDCKYMESITVHVWMDPVGDMHAGLVWSP